MKFMMLAPNLQRSLERLALKVVQRLLQRLVKNVDESYNEYQFIIQTDVEPWSEEIEKAAAKKAKRDAKGKKKQSVDDLM